MTVSVGFYKKIQQWLMDEYTDEITFRPFQVDGNPYKSNIFIVGLNSEPLANIEAKDISECVESLVDQKRFKQMNEAELINASREYKGTLNFVEWMKEIYKEDVVISNINCYVPRDIQMTKDLKKLNSPLLEKGTRIFKEVVAEFAPSVMILHGSTTLKEFQEQFSDRLIAKENLSLPVQELENKGVIAELNLKSGHKCSVLSCRSLSYFGKNGTKFTQFKEQLEKTMKSLE